MNNKYLLPVAILVAAVLLLIVGGGFIFPFKLYYVNNSGGIAIGQTINISGINITPLEVQDSRCPPQVQCIIAGWVSVVTQLSGSVKKQTLTVTEGKPAQIPDTNMALTVGVTPSPSYAPSLNRQPWPPQLSEYRFFYKITESK